LTFRKAAHAVDLIDRFDLKPGSNLEAGWGSSCDAEAQIWEASQKVTQAASAPHASPVRSVADGAMNPGLIRSGGDTPW
jgi:hypothetical protein